MVEVERATWEISCRNCDQTKPGKVIPESPPNGFLISRAVAKARRSNNQIQGESKKNPTPPPS